MHQSSYDRMAEFCHEYLASRQNEPLTIVDLGSCDYNGSYRPIFDRQPWRYVGADLGPGNNVDLILHRAYLWRELKSDSVDVLVSGQTFEHTEFFWETILEIERVLKPAGLCCIIAPATGEEHRYPLDCWRIFADGFHALARYAGLEVLRVQTHWKELPKYDAESNKWHESVLIARKPRRSLGARLRYRLFALARHWLHPLPQRIEAAIQVYYSAEGSHREDASVTTSVHYGTWQDVSITLPQEAGACPLRLDLMHTLEFVEIAALRVCTPTAEYFAATKKEDFDRITVAGDAERVPHPKLLRLRITGVDPQLVLPALVVKPGDQPLRVDLRLHVEGEGTRAGSWAGAVGFAREKAGDFWRQLLPRTSRQGSTPQDERLEKSYIWSIDEPRDWREVPRNFRLAGWCFSAQGKMIEGLRARLDDREFSVNHGLSRPDVAAVYPEHPEAGRSGFEVMIEAPGGSVYQFHVEAQAAGESWKEIFKKRVQVAEPLHGEAHEIDGSYEDWISKYDALQTADLTRIREQIESYERKPRFSILMPVSAATPYLRTAIESVRAQLYPFWQLIIVADKSLADEARRLAGRDRQIEVRARSEDEEIADALNTALVSAEGEFVLTLGSEDSLAPTALYFMALTLNLHPEARLLYSDEDRLDAAGLRADPHFKSDWNWELLLGQNFVAQLTVIRADLARAHGYRTGLDAARDYDLLLRCAESAEPEQIHHVSRVLYHRRAVRSSPEEEVSAVRQHLERLRIQAEVSLVESGEEVRRVSYHLPAEPPSVSIIIPTRDRVDLLRPCVQSILEKTAYRAFEIIVIDNGSRESAVLDYLAVIAHDPRVRVLPRDEEFNYSRLTNHGVQKSEAEFVLLMNNDVSVIEPGWLDEMVGQAIQPGVGAVGARLLYPDNRVQQAGVILGAGVHGVAEVAHRGIARSAAGHFSRALLAQEVSAVGAACMLVKRALYLQVGGFDEEHLKVAFNDIDFCLKLRTRGARIIYTPWAELYHHEHASRGTEYTEANEQRFIGEIHFMKEKWGDTLTKDPFYNPNLSLERDFYTLAFPPRVTQPWEQTPGSLSPVDSHPDD